MWITVALLCGLAIGYVVGHCRGMRATRLFFGLFNDHTNTSPVDQKPFSPPRGSVVPFNASPPRCAPRPFIKAPPPGPDPFGYRCRGCDTMQDTRAVHQCPAVRTKLETPNMGGYPLPSGEWVEPPKKVT